MRTGKPLARFRSAADPHAKTRAVPLDRMNDAHQGRVFFAWRRVTGCKSVRLCPARLRPSGAPFTLNFHLKLRGCAAHPSSLSDPLG